MNPGSTPASPPPRPFEPGPGRGVRTKYEGTGGGGGGGEGKYLNQVQGKGGKVCVEERRKQGTGGERVGEAEPGATKAEGYKQPLV